MATLRASLWVMNSSVKADFCIHVSLLGERGSYCYILNVLLTLFIFIVFFLLF